MITALLHGIILAFGLIIPLGTQNVFVFNQGVSQPSYKKALPVILTASLCDTVLIILAVLGISMIVFTIPSLKIIFLIVGLLFLIYMGYSIWKSNPAKLNKKDAEMPPKKQIIFALSVSLLNPHAILDTIGVIGTSSLNYNGIEKVVFTSATIVVSWCWFFSLALIGKLIGHFDNNGRFIQIINKISAITIWIVAIIILKQLLNSF